MTMATFLDDNKPKILFKSKFALFQSSSNLFNFKNCQILVKFSGFNPKGSYLSLEKEKETFCAVFIHSVKRVC